jgi:exopolyphosphatase/guanosine-5'-triphosphate,3'-diphosphate pyrophosphatase
MAIMRLLAMRIRAYGDGSKICLQYDLAIDIGTNSIRLIIAEAGTDSFRELYSSRRTTRLGKDLDRTGRLSPDAMERSFSALSEFSASILRFSACQTSAIGTSALRNASNSQEFIAEAHRRTGIAVRVISGEEEARLTLWGKDALRGWRRGRPACRTRPWSSISAAAARSSS